MRKLIITSVILLATAISGYAQTETKPDCKNPKSQADMNACSELEFEKADYQLTRLYKQVTSLLEAEPRKSVVESQKHWIIVRDNHCEVFRYFYKDGSLLPVSYNNCKTQLTNDRSKELNSILEEIKRR